MSTGDRHEDVVDAAEALLDRGLAELLRDEVDVPPNAPIQRRRWLGLGLLVLAVFCVLVAAVPWHKGAVDVAMWIGFGVVLLLLGGWQIDAAARAAARCEARIEELRGSAGHVNAGLRIVKRR